MSRQEGILRVIHAVSVLPADPSPEESLFDSGALDSFTLPDLVSGLEKEFGVTIPDSDLLAERFESVTKIEAYLNSRKC